MDFSPRREPQSVNLKETISAPLSGRQNKTFVCGLWGGVPAAG